MLYGGAIFGSQSLTEEMFEDLLQVIEDANLRYAELRANILPVAFRTTAKFTKADIKKIDEIISSYNLKYTVHAPDSMERFDFSLGHIDEKQAKKTFDTIAETQRFAAEIDAKLFVFHLGKVLSGIESYMVSVSDNTKQNYDMLRNKQLKKSIDLAERLIESAPLPSVIENSPPKPSSIILGDRLEDFHDYKYEICFDTGHMLLSSSYYNYPFESFIEHYKERIKHIHLHKNFQNVADKIDHENKIGDLHLLPEIGDKFISDMRDFLKNYRGIIIFELWDVDIEKLRKSKYVIDSLILE